MEEFAGGTSGELLDFFSWLRDAEWGTQRLTSSEEEGEGEEDAEEGARAHGGAPDPAHCFEYAVEEGDESDDVQLVPAAAVEEDDVVEVVETSKLPPRPFKDATALLMASRGGAAAPPRVRVEAAVPRRAPFAVHARGPAPFYKRVPGTSFILDGFTHVTAACTHYFLSHAHADHYGGLTRAFSTLCPGGKIFCSSVTAALMHLRFGLGLSPAGPLVPLPFSQTMPIPDGGGARVTLLDANHCPGAAMMLFEVPVPGGPAGRYRAFLHSGDFRWHARLSAHPCLRAYCGPPTSAAPPSAWATALAAGSRLEAVFLDTTYASTGRDFPSQEATVGVGAYISSCAVAAEPRTLLLFGSYSIGKERLFLAVAHALNERIYAPPAKLRMLRAAGLPAEDVARLTDDPRAARIHVVPMAALSLSRLTAQLRVLQAHASAYAAAAAGEGGSGADRLTLINRAVRQEAAAAAAVIAIGGKRALPSAAAVGNGRLPASLAKKSRGRGGAFAALIAQSRAAAALQPLQANTLAGAGAAHPAPAPTAAHTSFTSIVAFKPTGWVSVGGQQASAAAGQGAGAGGSPPRVGRVPSLWDRREEGDRRGGGRGEEDGEDVAEWEGGGGGQPAFAPPPPGSLKVHMPGSAGDAGQTGASAITLVVPSRDRGPESVTVSVSTRGSAVTGRRILAGLLPSPPPAPPAPTAACVLLFGIPYSEHSSLPELQAAVRAFSGKGKPTIIPTVNCRSAEAARKTVALVSDPAGHGL